jgi:hypothetical protein
MADKVAKPKKQKPKQKAGEQSVMGALPSQRPARIGGDRPSAPAGNAPAARTVSETAAKPANGAAKPARAASKPATKPATKAASKPRATAARRKAAAPRTFEPTAAAESAAGDADARAAGAVPTPEPEPARRQRPRAVRKVAPGTGPVGPEPPLEPEPEHGRPSGVELVATAIQAAGEVAQIGLAIGGRIVKRAVDRLPKP